VNAKYEPGAEERDDLVDSAWTLVQEALDSGSFRLKSGLVITLTPDQLVRHMQWVASLGKRRPSTTPALKDFFLAQTKKDRKDDRADDVVA
jgi:hypothetical protein